MQFFLFFEYTTELALFVAENNAHTPSCVRVINVLGNNNYM